MIAYISFGFTQSWIRNYTRFCHFKYINVIYIFVSLSENCHGALKYYTIHIIYHLFSLNIFSIYTMVSNVHGVLIYDLKVLGIVIFGSGFWHVDFDEHELLHNYYSWTWI